MNWKRSDIEKQLAPGSFQSFVSGDLKMHIWLGPLSPQALFRTPWLSEKCRFMVMPWVRKRPCPNLNQVIFISVQSPWWEIKAAVLVQVVKMLCLVRVLRSGQSLGLTGKRGKCFDLVAGSTSPVLIFKKVNVVISLFSYLTNSSLSLCCFLANSGSLDLSVPLSGPASLLEWAPLSLVELLTLQ